MPIFRPANPDDAERISHLLTVTFDVNSTPGWEIDALARFHARNNYEQIDIAIATAVYQEVCVNSGEIVAYLYMPRPYLIGILAVHPSLQGHGIGSALLQRGRQYVLSHHPEVTVLQVNATERSEPFYAAHSFFPLSPYVMMEGMRFRRMGYWCGLAVLNRDLRVED
ncbi:MAG TPA: GNAT family N-acetyltransferase [Noviherbaspirillum sp.]|nr:GNAT family N-acetyltransferase [Noviherbaspirillum sp.]